EVMPAVRDRLPRFSLLTLLLIFTVVCISLASLGLRLRSIQEQRSALANLARHAPGIVSTHGDVQVLSLSTTETTDDDLRQVGRLHYLQRLDLELTHITDAGLTHLDSLDQVRFLSLNWTNISDKGLSSLAGLSKLEELRIADTQITDFSMELVSKL